MNVLSMKFAYKLMPLFALGTAILCTNCAHKPVNAKPAELVIVAHGFGRGPSAMKSIAEHIESRGYAVHSIGYSSLFQSIAEIKAEVEEEIYREDLASYRKVHFVGHSFGGLLVRSFLDEHNIPNLGHVVNVGSPAKGTPIVEYYKTKWWFSLAGPAASALSSKGSSFLSSLQKPEYSLGVIAGNIDRPDRENILRGADDGLVPVESTKVEGMNQFLVLPTTHWGLRYDSRVADEITHYLETGRFQGAG